MVRVVLCSEGQASARLETQEHSRRAPSSPHQVAHYPKALLGAGVGSLWSSGLASGVCGHVCMCHTQECLASSSTFMGNKVWMGRRKDTLNSPQLCCLGKEPIVASLGTGEFSYLTLEGNRMGERDLGISTRDSLFDQTFLDAPPLASVKSGATRKPVLTPATSHRCRPHNP